MEVVRIIIIGLPPKGIGERIAEQRSRISEALGSREALHYPVHITLRTGLVCRKAEAEGIAARFLAHAACHRRAIVGTEGIFSTSFRGHDGLERGLLGHSVRLDATLLALHSYLLEFTEAIKGAQAAYSPHISLAYHDIDRAAVLSLYERLSECERKERFAWSLDNVPLCVEAGGSWIEFGRTKLEA